MSARRQPAGFACARPQTGRQACGRGPGGLLNDVGRHKWRPRVRSTGVGARRRMPVCIRPLSQPPACGATPELVQVLCRVHRISHDAQPTGLGPVPGCTGHNLPEDVLPTPRHRARPGRHQGVRQRPARRGFPWQVSSPRTPLSWVPCRQGASPPRLRSPATTERLHHVAAMLWIQEPQHRSRTGTQGATWTGPWLPL